MDLRSKIADMSQNKKGSAIAYALVVIAMVSILLSSVVQFVANQAKSAYQVQSKEQAFQIAEAGVNFYRWYLAHETDGKTSMQVRDFWQGTSPYPYGLQTAFEKEYVDAQGGALGKYSIRIPEEVDLSSTIVKIEVTGWTYKYPNLKRTIKVRFRRPSWSENSVLANDFMRFGEGTTVNGKIHSNSGIRFDGIATNVVSSSLSTFDDPDHSGGVEFGVHTHVNVPPATGVNDSQRPLEAPPKAISQRIDVFKAGRKFPVTQVDFASVVSDISYMRSQAAIKFDNSGVGRRIILKTDGTFDVCKVSSYSVYVPTDSTTTSGITGYAGITAGATGAYASTNGAACVATSCCNSVSTCSWIQASRTSRGKCISMTNSVIPSDGIIFVANNIWLEGTVNNKKVSIVAAELPDEPGYSGVGKNIFLGMGNLSYTNFDGSDIIGLIAQKDIEVIKNSLDNLTIDGALLAKDGRVGRYDYGNSKSSITVNGSIATYGRYGFAYTDGTGYHTRNLNFDNNMLYFPPPYFPTGTQYSIDLWEEE